MWNVVIFAWGTRQNSSHWFFCHSLMLRFTVSKVRNAHNDEDLLKWRNRKIEIGFINKTRTFECTYTARADATVLIFFPFILFFFCCCCCCSTLVCWYWHTSPHLRFSCSAHRISCVSWKCLMFDLVSFEKCLLQVSFLPCCNRCTHAIFTRTLRCFIYFSQRFPADRIRTKTNSSKMQFVWIKSIECLWEWISISESW